MGEAEVRATSDRAKDAMMVGGCMICVLVGMGEFKGLDGRRLWIMDRVEMGSIGMSSCQTTMRNVKNVRWVALLMR